MKKIIFCLFLFVHLGINAQVPSYVPTNGLVGWWPFNGNANDESGNGNHGTVNGATLTVDRFGGSNKAYNFNGTSNNIQFPYSTLLNPQPPFSISFYGLVNYLNQSQTWISTNPYGISKGWDFMPFQHGGMNIEVSIDNTWNSFTSKYLFSLSTWIHCVALFTNSNIFIYVNNNLIETYNIPFGSITYGNALPLVLGSTVSGSNWLNGKLDEIAIYNRLLTQTEITALYQACSTTTASITPQGSTTICQGNSVVLNATTGSNYTYEWYKNGTLINGVSTSSYSAIDAGNYTVKVIDGSCNATSSATTLNLIDTITWTGNLDNDWHKPCNWSPEIVPECCNSVKIPLTTNSPVVSGVAKAKNVNVYSTSGATLTVNNGANLQIETCPVTKTENSCPTLPVLTTTVISNTTQTSAVSGGNITYAGSSSITARGVCWRTTTSPTIANLKTTDGSGIGSFTSSISGLTAGTTYYVRAYATNANGTSYGNEVSFIAVNPQPAYPVGSVFCNGTPTIVIDVTNPTTGKTWMDRNLGATQAATSSTDVAAYGDLYQWGRGSDGHQCRNSATTSILSSTDVPGNNNFILTGTYPNDWRSPQNYNLWQGTNGVNNPCPSGYRLPTDTELDTERLSWTSQNSNGAYSSALKLPSSGYRNHVYGTLKNIGTNGLYWSSSWQGDPLTATNSEILNFSTNAFVNSFQRAHGFSVRCIKN